MLDENGVERIVVAGCQPSTGYLRNGKAITSARPNSPKKKSLPARSASNRSTARRISAACVARSPAPSSIPLGNVF